MRHTGFGQPKETGAGIWPTIDKAKEIADQTVKRLLNPECSIVGQNLQTETLPTHPFSPSRYFPKENFLCATRGRAWLAARDESRTDREPSQGVGDRRRRARVRTDGRTCAALPSRFGPKKKTLSATLHPPDLDRIGALAFKHQSMPNFSLKLIEYPFTPIKIRIALGVL